MENKKVALVTGICGQDGSFLAELLLEKGYIVHGIMRRAATFNTQNIDHIFDKLNLHYGDITDSMNVFNIISKVRPCEIYNLCAMSHVKVSHDIENYTFQAALGPLIFRKVGPAPSFLVLWGWELARTVFTGHSR